jgi:hypothetical protein
MTLAITIVVVDEGGAAEIMLYVSGAAVPTGIKAPTTVAAVRMLVDRLNGTAP